MIPTWWRKLKIKDDINTYIDSNGCSINTIGSIGFDSSDESQIIYV